VLNDNQLSSFPQGIAIQGLGSLINMFVIIDIVVLLHSKIVEI
jgi:hypothetical protein